MIIVPIILMIRGAFHEHREDDLELVLGGFVMAVDHKFPILPVNRSRKVLVKGATVYSSGPVEVVVGDPIDTTTYSRDNLENLIRQTRDAIITNFNPAYPERLNIGKESS